MALSDACMEKLKQWIKTDTWHTGHDLDSDRFYCFVDQYRIDHGTTVPDEQILAETMASIAEVSNSESRLFEIIKERVSRMVTILDFLKATKQ